MNKLLIVLTIVAAFILGGLAGTYYPAVVNDDPSIAEYIKRHDQGCNKIVREVNHTTGRDGLVCEVYMQSEDDELYVLKWGHHERE